MLGLSVNRKYCHAHNLFLFQFNFASVQNNGRIMVESISKVSYAAGCATTTATTVQLILACKVFFLQQVHCTMSQVIKDGRQGFPILGIQT